MSDDARDVQAALAARNDPLASTTTRHAGHQAFARIYDRHAPVIRAVCFRLCASPSDVDDALQETFIRAYRLLHEVADPSGLRGWLYAIARHVCSERRRAAGRRHAHEHAAAEVGMTHDGKLPASPVEPAPQDAAQRSEALDRLTAAIDELSDEERLAIHLYYLDADPIQAASATLGLSRSGFYKLLNRAKEHLGTLMGAVKP